ncbi:hypothetical protein [Halobacteriovorax sp. JY17]|uniref:hypothetical protein n=1 Tax=Halobacteriovorax sp. JY17 TaxID=2014617 RepID=UPI000C3DBF99|nr:hypothetical protein [Halobacteriovorax sp. JY17]PIK13586.1 MAG: hypothetical protein CES88_15460 [Halobacteriovorax sp. JY17]
MKFILVFLFIFSTHSAECVSSSLKKIGFGFASKKEFSVIENNVKKWVQDNEQDFILDYESRMFSSVYGKFVLVTSLDNIQTSEDEMFGDVVFIRDLNSGKILEIRWFQHGLKLVAFDRKMQSCPTAVVPLAENTLF